jgi:uncharacterized membrane protein
MSTTTAAAAVCGFVVTSYKLLHTMPVVMVVSLITNNVGISSLLLLVDPLLLHVHV